MEKPIEQQASSTPVTVFIIGMGQRGTNYAQYSLEFPNKMKVVAVAEPRKVIQEQAEKLYNLKKEQIFDDWRLAFKMHKQKIADCVVIALQDQDHYECAIACANMKYDILLEKPMAVDKQQCIEIAESCKKNNVLLVVCHVLRYTPWNNKIKELISTNQIGKLVNIQHYEPVGYWHFAHSYVRGNWRNESKSSFSLMTKSCHDIDLISWWTDKKCLQVSSFGNLNYFKKENKPLGAGNRCLECKVEEQCPYSAKKIYLESFQKGRKGWPNSVVCYPPDIEGLTSALKQGPYGRCVFECDNDVVDNQVVIFQFDDNITASFTMCAYTEDICQRRTCITGTEGEITLLGTEVKLFTFKDKKTTLFKNPQLPQTQLKGHDGGDFYLMDTFINALYTKNHSLIKTNADDTLKSHLLVFAAEESRKSNSVLKL